MEKRIGVLLPRSTDYPAMAFDMLDGLRISLVREGAVDVRTIAENIGFGENQKHIYNRAEKLLLQDEVDCIVAYLSPANAASLYPLLEAAGKMLIVLDPGMSYPTAAKSNYAQHISLQGLHTSYLSGRRAAKGGREVVMATSFYDGGYSGPWAGSRGAGEEGGIVKANYVSHYKEAEFTIQPFREIMDNQPGSSVAACYSTYLATMFINSLHNNGLPRHTEFHCSSFMVEEQIMASYTLPEASFFAYVPWTSVLENEENKTFLDIIAQKKNKTANIFHLLGWEAGILCARMLSSTLKEDDTQAELLLGWSYQSPRGTVTLHSETNTTYAPVYHVEMTRDDNGKAGLNVLKVLNIDAAEHLRVLNDRPEGISSGWFNNYLCT